MLHRYAGLVGIAGVIAACSAASGTGGSPSPFAASGGSNGGGAAGASASGAVPGGGHGNATGLSGASDMSPDLGPIKEQDASTVKCNAIVNKGEQITVDIFIMFDQSASMTCAIPSGGDRWTAVKDALIKFVQDPGAAGINVGIQYFGLGQGGRRGGQNSSCTPSDYQTPDVEIGPLPMNSQPIVDSVNRHMASTNTPTPAALAGAINHAIDWKNAHPGHTVVVVLVTDGQPNQCGAVADVVNVAGAGLTRTIPTYVIGVISPGTTCDLDPNPPNQPDLDAVAMAGGSQMALMVDVTQDTAAQFLDTMNKIRAKTQVPCQYTIPKAPSGQMIDPTKVNVQYTPPGAAMPTTILGVTMATCDPVNGGWYYDNPAAPTKINLCPVTCTAISGQTGGQIDVTVGCATQHPR